MENYWKNNFRTKAWRARIRNSVLIALSACNRNPGNFVVASRIRVKRYFHFPRGSWDSCFRRKKREGMENRERKRWWNILSNIFRHAAVQTSFNAKTNVPVARETERVDDGERERKRKREKKEGGKNRES